MQYEAMTVREWTDLIRRARLGRTTKAVALMLATYADFSTGDRIHPGLARLSITTELSYNVVQAAVAELRRAGLLQVVKPARRAGDADEYRLTLSEETPDLIEVWNPTQVDMAAEKVRRTKQGRHRAKPDPHPTAWGAVIGAPDPLHPTAQGAATIGVPVDNPDLHPTARDAGASVEIRPAPHGVGAIHRPAPHGVGDLHPTAWVPTPHYRDTTTTSHHTGDIRTDAEVIAREGSEPDDLEERSTPAWDDPTPPPTRTGRAVGRASVPTNVVPLRPKTA